MKTVVRVFNKKYYSVRTGNQAEHWGELMFLYDDRTWEKIFEYRWTDPFDRKLINSTHLKNRSRKDALTSVEKAYFKDKIKGIFMV